ncbi:spike base protein, RCAP_Rcc01079 family [Paenibacillus periandrae]|uniref:spike base protein, RCAP_Rcc01079 family n=1 Tax=Paenibacillus periandrae TaxID=1761741 RepID=UPI001F096E6C|nr:hypothetical protein [Paenibacillus periandrae]
MQIYDRATGKWLWVGVGNPLPTTQSARSALAVTPSNTVDLAEGATKYVYVGADGDLKVDMADGTTVTFTALPAGVFHPLAVKRIHATGTTATGIVAVR